METPKGQMTILEAANSWIAMIEDPQTKATPEQKAAMISQIRAAVPNVKFLVGSEPATDSSKATFVTCTNAIKHVMRG